MKISTSRVASVAVSLVTAFLTVTIVVLLVKGERLKVPSDVLAVTTALSVPLFAWWLSKRQVRTWQKEEETQEIVRTEMLPRVKDGIRAAIETAEIRGFVRGSHASARTLLEGLPIAFIEISSASGRIIRTNSQADELFGYDRGEMLSLPVQMLVPEENRTEHMADMRRYIDDPGIRPMGVYRQVTGRRKDGARIPLKITLGPFEGVEEATVIAVIVAASDDGRHGRT